MPVSQTDFMLLEMEFVAAEIQLDFERVIHPVKVPLLPFQLPAAKSLLGNAFYLLARFRGLTKRLGWPDACIDAVLLEAQLQDYDHLRQTLDAWCVTPPSQSQLTQ